MILNKKKGKKSKDKAVFSETPSTVSQQGSPENCSEMVNFYGTYNIQQTQNASNTYPTVGQGLSKEETEKLKKECERWLREDETEQ